MWWAVLFIAFAVAMAVGPIMLLRPSAKEKRLTQLRDLAAKHGLRVKMLAHPAQGSSSRPQTVAAYGLWLNLSPTSPLNTAWTLVRTEFSHELHFSGHWDWLHKEKQAPISDDAFLSYLSNLPESVVALEQAGKDLSVYWTEMPLPGQALEQAFNGIHTHLLNLAELIKPGESTRAR